MQELPAILYNRTPRYERGDYNIDNSRSFFECMEEKKTIYIYMFIHLNLFTSFVCFLVVASFFFMMISFTIKATGSLE